jgi:hypothetical protein
VRGRTTRLGLVVSTLVAAVGMACSSSQTDHQRQNAPITRSFERDQGPFAHGEKLSLEDAEKTVPFHLYRPDNDLASDTSVRSTFVETTFDDEGNQFIRAAIDYDSGVLLTIWPAPSSMISDPLAFWTKKMAENDGRSVETILGEPALVIQRDVNDAGNPAAVAMVMEGLQITLYGQYAPIGASELVETAKTIA